MRSPKIVGLVAALSVGAIVVAFAQSKAEPPTFWPATEGGEVLEEWFSDIPWQQKLGTFAGNQINVPLVLPYEALGDPEKEFCEKKTFCVGEEPTMTCRSLSKPECMIEVGINNLLGMHRIDTRYDQTATKIAAADECKRGLDCIQVTLDLHSYSTRPVKKNDQDEVALVAQVFGVEPQHGYRNSQYGGYVVTDGTTYAPQMPWYMAHYCDAKFKTIPPNDAPKDVQDPVCYGDYHSPMNNGFNPRGEPANQWPRSVPFSPAQSDPAPAPNNHCASGKTVCTLALAGFDLTPLSPTMSSVQYSKYNQYLLDWFNQALVTFGDQKNELNNKHKFPWPGSQVSWAADLYPRAKLNPFLGEFKYSQTEAPSAPQTPPALPCDVFPEGANHANCIQTAQQRGYYAYPRQCKLDDLAGGSPDSEAVDKLRQCGLNYEIHHNGTLEQWPKKHWDTLIDNGFAGNQYGRTSFLFAGIRGMQMAVSFFKDPDGFVDPLTHTSLSVYERVHNASIFSLYLPMANVADSDPSNVFFNRFYNDQNWFHTLLMGNHMEADPEHFVDGIRGKVLWHNEYRTQKQFSNLKSFNPDEWFAGAFKTGDAKVPYHNNTCDGCHVRNGSGIPTNTENKLDPIMTKFMDTDKVYEPYIPAQQDYTFTGKIRPMKLVFFDLKRDARRLDASRHSEPLSFSAAQIKDAPRTMLTDDFYYSNKIMNFYGDSYHVTTRGYDYKWSYGKADESRVVATVPPGKPDRFDPELLKSYVPQQVNVSNFTTNGTCELVTKPDGVTKPWPASCTEVNGAAIAAAIEQREIGFMHLNGKRLGNLSVIESIPNKSIKGFREAQEKSLGPKIAGEIIWTSGSRDGINRKGESKIFKKCRLNTEEDCFIGRFGWIGDRASLEDQVANAAFVEMNMTTSAGYESLYFNQNQAFPIRYNVPNCGPANKTCVDSLANGDLTEIDIGRMADYARWIGNPTRSELKVSMKEVIEGEKVFRDLNCDTCHVIDKIKILYEDTMLTKNYRDRLKKQTSDKSTPFLSYIGTDLLMHDMGYLSQVGVSTTTIRDADGVVLPEYKNFVQKIRTPVLKGLRFNRFVTDSHRNTRKPDDPACDFLLHDGRACDAIEATFLHDGPAIKKLNVIGKLDALGAEKVKYLRAFLYSL